MTATPRHPVPERYRPDIDGLRCIAVLGVIFCHVKLSGFSGGFVGVDVFFVISGYLISRNILDQLQAGRFSLLAFYDRRIRRIFPALIATIAASFAAGLVLNSPEQFRILAGDVVSAVFSIVNIRFWKGAHDYFAASSDDRALLHLWSLSVEEQFYLVWPALLLLLAWLKSPRLQAVTLALVFAGSLAAAQLWLPRDAAAVFYLTPFRVFEFAAGALVVLAERRWAVPLWLSSAGLVAGLLMILVPMVAYSPATPFPGLTALAPVLGGALVIYSRSRGPLSFVLGNRAAVAIGRVSYSLYLCHWPVIVFARQVNVDADANIWCRIALLAVTAVLAVALYFGVERPFRARSAPTKAGFWRLQAACAILIAIVAGPAYAAFRQDGWSWRFNAAQQELMRKQAFAYAPCKDFDCVFGHVSGPLGVQIIGDSYAQQYVAALQPLLLKLGLRGEAYTYGGCLMLEGLRLTEPVKGTICAARRDAALAKVRNSAAPVLIAEAWSRYQTEFSDDDGRPLVAATAEQRRERIVEALSRTLTRIGTADRRVLVIGGDVLTNCAHYDTEVRRIMPPPRDKSCDPPTIASTRARTGHWNSDFLALVAQQRGRVSLLRSEDYLCTDVCPVVKDGIWLYRDSGHLTVAGAELLGSRAHEPLMTFLTGKGASGGIAVQDR